MDDAAIKEWVETDHERVVRALTLICGDRQRAEDAVQDAVLDVWGRRRDVADLSAWITTAALNRVRSSFRRAAAERRALDRLAARPRPAGGAPSDGVDDRLARALVALPPSQREIVVLHYLLDLSVADVAARVGVVEGTVKTQLHRARAALRGAVLELRPHDVEDENV